MKTQGGDYADWMKMFGLDLEGVRARFGCQCNECRRSEVELREREKQKELKR